MGLYARYREVTRTRKIIFFTVLFFIFYTVFGFFILPLIVKKVSAQKLSEFLERPVTISRVTFNPYSLIITIEDLIIKEKNSDKTFFATKKVLANIQTSSIFRLGPVVREINVDGLFCNAVRIKDQTYNFSDLIPKDTSEGDERNEDKEGKSNRPLRFSISNIVLTSGNIIINDIPKNKTHYLSEMEIAIPFISNLNTHMDVFVTPHFSVNFNGSPITLEGETKPFLASQTTMMNLDLQGIDLKTYFDYLPVKTNIKLIDGKMDIFCSLEFSQHENPDLLPRLFLSGGLNLYKLSLEDIKSKPIFDMDELSISLGKSEVLKGLINIDNFTLSAPEISLLINNSKQLNIYNLLPREKPEKTAKEKNEKPFPMEISLKNIGVNNALISLNDTSEKKTIFSLESFSIGDTKISTEKQLIDIDKISSSNADLNIFRINDKRINLESLIPVKKIGDNDEENTIQNKPLWNANISNIGLENYSIIARDLISKDKGEIILDQISLKLKNFSTLPESKAETTLSLLVNTDGKIDISGNTGLNPISSNLDLFVKQIHLDKFQPFLSEYLNLILSDGKFSTSGRLSMIKPEKEAVKATYEGDLKIDSFKTIDIIETKPLAAFNELDIKGAKLNSVPLSVDIAGVQITKPLLNIKIDKNGSINFDKLLKKSEKQDNTDTEIKDNEPGVSDVKENSKIQVSIKKVTVKNGNIAVNDQSVQPRFKTNLANIYASVTGLSSEDTIKSDININAKINRHTPIEIKGKINPLKTDFFCDMIVACSNMDLGYLSPYSGKYAGYKIQKGKLSLDLQYFIDQKKLDSTNNVFLDQFDFGEEVESEDAINAPMKLAVSLLKDPSGRISLDIPVKGNLDDPEFSVGGIIIQVIINLLKKAATAPFSLLGAMFGGGEDLNIITFESGTSGVTPEESNKIATLIKALTQRPGLNLDITGYVNIAQDRSALINKKFDQTLKTEKLKNNIKKGEKAIPVDEITLSDEEYNMILQTLFDKSGKKKSIRNQLKQKQAESQKKLPGDNDNNGAEEEAAKNNDIEITSEMMINALKEDIQVTDDELKHLANERALAIKGALLADENIDPERIFIVEARSLEPEQTAPESGSRSEPKSGSESVPESDTAPEAEKGGNTDDSPRVILTLK